MYEEAKTVRQRDNLSVLAKPVTQGRYQGFLQDFTRQKSFDQGKAFRVRLP